MLLKSIIVSLALTQSGTIFVSGLEYWESFNSSVDPTNIDIPSVSQTTSHDPVTECVPYNPTNVVINPADWPTPWLTATSNGMNTSAEFLSLYNSIDWASMPNISVRTRTSTGDIDTSGYDTVNDPDCWWSASTCTVPKHAGVTADIYTCPEPETWGLTFDDGPNCSHNAFYDYLAKNRIKASMFYIGSNVLDWPYGAQRGVKDGHHIADHTWSHQLMTTLTNQEVLAELYYTQKAIKVVTGVTPKHWRPAYGDVDDRVRWIATQLNLTTVLWDLDTDDWAAGDTVPVSTVQKTYEDFITMGTNGTFNTSGNVVLTHEIGNTTMSLAIDYLPRIMSSYKNVVDVATCMNITHPYFETAISFVSFGSSNSTANATTSAGNATATDTASAGSAKTSTQGEPSRASAVLPNMMLVSVSAVALTRCFLLV
ncbi:hypothetical protein BX666DRAFT_1909249 [Dichotomocladium elegans]|nr:hypothetical protein BX666DRAFT_1909249 [Dichotomocladium elegans]